MFFSINPTNGLAIFDQIVRQVKFAVAHGTLAPGDMVPSVRELAKELAVNPNTVVRAYRDLTNEGILEAVRGTGLNVTADAVAHCEKERLGLLRERVRHVLEEAQSSRLETSEIRELVEEELARLERSSKGKRTKASGNK
ncbi:MAG: GntR family transcriptional regulator [Planctomycetaceae bacterium]